MRIASDRVRPETGRHPLVAEISERMSEGTSLEKEIHSSEEPIPEPHSDLLSNFLLSMSDLDVALGTLENRLAFALRSRDPSDASKALPMYGVSEFDSGFVKHVIEAHNLLDNLISRVIDIRDRIQL
jgi:hypothetical protein